MFSADVGKGETSSEANAPSRKATRRVLVVASALETSLLEATRRDKALQDPIWADIEVVAVPGLGEAKRELKRRGYSIDVLLLDSALTSEAWLANLKKRYPWIATELGKADEIIQRLEALQLPTELPQAPFRGGETFFVDDADDILISASLCGQPWVLEGDALALTVAPSGVLGSFTLEYLEWVANERSQSGSGIVQLRLSQAIAQQGTAEPVHVQGLEQHLAEQVRMELAAQKFQSPSTPQPQSSIAPEHLFLINTHNDSGAQSISTVVNASVAAIRAAASQPEVHTLVLPLMGTGSRDLDAGLLAAEILTRLRQNPLDAPLQHLVFTVGREDQLGRILTFAPDRSNDQHAQPFSNDIPQGRDQLGIQPEVEALADAIALKTMDPPLVVGVLGGWGSGKSFVLHLLLQRLAHLRRHALTEQNKDAFPYVGHPYWIHFDAWTYAKSDLWASLMQTILAELSRAMAVEELVRSAKSSLEDGALWEAVAHLSAQGFRALNNEVGEELLEQLRDSGALGPDSDGKLTSTALWEALGARHEKEKTHLDELKMQRADKMRLAISEQQKRTESLEHRLKQRKDAAREDTREKLDSQKQERQRRADEAKAARETARREALDRFEKCQEEEAAEAAREAVHLAALRNDAESTQLKLQQEEGRLADNERRAFNTEALSRVLERIISSNELASRSPLRKLLNQARETQKTSSEVEQELHTALNNVKPLENLRYGFSRGGTILIVAALTLTLVLGVMVFPHFASLSAWHQAFNELTSIIVCIAAATAFYLQASKNVLRDGTELLRVFNQQAASLWEQEDVEARVAKCLESPKERSKLAQLRRQHQEDVSALEAAKTQARERKLKAREAKETALEQADAEVEATLATEERLQEEAHQRELQDIVERLERQLAAERTQAEQTERLEAEKARTSLEKTDASIARCRARIGMTARAESLAEFLADRVEGATYEQHLGLMHQIHSDLMELSESLLVAARETTKAQLFPRGEPRIFLVIDDLDRCPPDKVVQMLEAVQLLVKTKLFVVILAVDVRYVTRALEKEYEGILVSGGRPSGLDYIEKIIQVPYRVPRIHEDQFGGLLASQMRVRPDSIASPSSTPANSGPLSSKVRLTPAEPLERGARQMVVTRDQAAASAEEPARAKAPWRVFGPARETTLLPENVHEFEEHELSLLTDACKACGVGPRAAKRLVNVFKVLKIVWYRNAANGTPSRDVKALTLFLLALSARCPDAMRRILRALEDASRDSRQQDVVLLAFAKQVVENERAQLHPEECQRFEACLSLWTSTSSGLTLKDIGDETVRQISSFSFVGDLGRSAAPTVSTLASRLALTPSPTGSADD